MKEMLLRIEGPDFVVRVLFRFGVVIESAPIVNYMCNWDLQAVLDYCKERRWKYRVIEEDDGPQGNPRLL